MSTADQLKEKESVQQRLLNAAFDLFLSNDYHKVTNRMLASHAETSASSIPYYFGDKHKLYEAMVREQFRQIGQVLETSFDPKTGLNFSALMTGYLDIHQRHPDFPAFFTNILTYKNGPGYKLFSEILDQKRGKIQKLVRLSQSNGAMRKEIDIDVLRVLMMSLSVFPFLIKGVLENSQQTKADDELFINMAKAAGELLTLYTEPGVKDD